MSIDNEPTGESPAPPHHVHVKSDAPVRVEVSTLDVDPAKLIAMEIIRRHCLLGTFDVLRKRADEAEGRAKTSAVVIFLAMTLEHGEVRDHCAGLRVTAGPDELAATFGLGPTVAYPSLRLLEDVGMIRRIPIRRGNDHFEVLMPALDEERSSQVVRSSTNGAETSADKDLARTIVHAQMGARAPSFTGEGARALDDEERARPSAREQARAPEPAVTGTIVRAQTSARARLSTQLDLLPENADACTGARASTGARAPVHVHVPCEEHVHVPAAQVGQGGKREAEALLRTITFPIAAEPGGPVAHKAMDEGGIRKMLQSPICTVARIELALRIMRDRMTRETIEKPHRLFFYLVTTTKDLYVPPTAEERRRESMPQHVQEELASKQQVIAARDARERAEADVVAGLEPARLEELVQQTLAEWPDGPHRSLLLKQRDNARNYMLWIPEIYKRLQVKGAQQA